MGSLLLGGCIPEKKKEWEAVRMIGSCGVRGHFGMSFKDLRECYKIEEKDFKKRKKNFEKFSIFLERRFSEKHLRWRDVEDSVLELKLYFKKGCVDGFEMIILNEKLDTLENWEI